MDLGLSHDTAEKAGYINISEANTLMVVSNMQIDLAQPSRSPTLKQKKKT